MSSPASGLLQWGDKLRQFPQKMLDAAGQVGGPIQQGVQSVGHMLGFPQTPPPRDTQYMAPVQDVQKANDSFKKPQGVLTQAAKRAR